MSILHSTSCKRACHLLAVFYFFLGPPISSSERRTGALEAFNMSQVWIADSCGFMLTSPCPRSLYQSRGTYMIMYLVCGLLGWEPHPWALSIWTALSFTCCCRSVQRSASQRGACTLTSIVFSNCLKLPRPCWPWHETHHSILRSHNSEASLCKHKRSSGA
jgi:hypothetical protein